VVNGIFKIALASSTPVKHWTVESMEVALTGRNLVMSFSVQNEELFYQGYLDNTWFVWYHWFLHKAPRPPLLAKSK